MCLCVCVRAHQLMLYLQRLQFTIIAGEIIHNVGAVKCTRHTLNYTNEMQIRNALRK